MNIQSLLLGGISTNVPSQYFGFNLNLMLIMNSILGGFSSNYIFIIFEGILILNPIILLFNKLKNIIFQFFGIFFFTVSIPKEEKIIYNKFQEYIRKKFSHLLNKSNISSKDH